MEEEEMQDLLGDDPGDGLDVSDDEDPMFGEDVD